MSIVGKLGGVEGKNVISELVKGGGSGSSIFAPIGFTVDEETGLRRLSLTVTEINNMRVDNKIPCIIDTGGGDSGVLNPDMIYGIAFFCLSEIAVEKGAEFPYQFTFTNIINSIASVFKAATLDDYPEERIVGPIVPGGGEPTA